MLGEGAIMVFVVWVGIEPMSDILVPVGDISPHVGRDLEMDQGALVQRGR